MKFNNRAVSSTAGELGEKELKRIGSHIAGVPFGTTKIAAWPRYPPVLEYVPPGTYPTTHM
jgi:hypothetical protein